MNPANEYLDRVYWDKFNNQFAVPPESSKNAHRKLLPGQDLKKILSHKKQGTLSKNLEVQCDNVIYQIVQKTPSWRLRKAKVTIIKTLDGGVYIEHNGKNLPFKVHSQQEACGKIVDFKKIDTFFKEKKTRTVPSDHPWNKEGRAREKIKQYKMASQGGV